MGQVHGPRGDLGGPEVRVCKNLSCRRVFEQSADTTKKKCGASLDPSKSKGSHCGMTALASAIGCTCKLSSETGVGCTCGSPASV